MRILSWNVNGIRALQRKGDDQQLHALEPDVLCLQETKCSRDDFPNLTLTKDLPHFALSESVVKKGYSGVATLSKQPFHSHTEGLGLDEFDQEGRVIRTEFEDFELYNIYFPNGASGDDRLKYKERFHDFLFDHLSEKIRRQDRPLMIVGDFNVAHSEIDIYDPIRHQNESGFLKQEREWMTEFLELGFVDAFRYKNPDAKDQYSWWSYRERARPANRGWRIDYICVSEDLADHIDEARLLQSVQGSDHCPVLLSLNLDAYRSTR